ncbi:DUF2637 domain-containing protein [Streptomyces sp. t39]|uniref:DUF2637 domain-containing protein n=1 Tax=Streptomyces sp. t39 TaxID=1828156 RepID=UPI0011CE0780|nr:DUF2637 domain-containing protein [Streptomyces sp. t39]TXS58217.1 DUF2637 domain-containing protein [Streptomyces sp. t39]
MTAVDFRKPDVIRPDGDDDPRAWDVTGPADHPDDHDQDPAHDDDESEEEQERGYAKWELWLAVFGVLLGTGVAVLGLYSSFGALYDKAALPASQGGWGWEDPWLLPVGIDLSILAFGIVNLLLIRARRPLWWIKWVPRGGTVLTIYLNWEAANTLPAQVGHAGLAALWVIFSEIAAHLYAAHIGEVHGARRMGKIRLTRWLCQPRTTWRIWKLMRQDEITDYEVALAHHKEWMVYEQRLASKYQTRRWRRKAVQEELAPFQLAKVGLSVDEALAVPLMEEVREATRLADAAFQRTAAEVQRVKADVQLGAARIQAEVDKIRSEGQLKIARAEAEREAQAEIQRAEADAQLREAKRQHALKLAEDQAAAEAQELSDETEKRRTLAQIDREKVQASWGLEKQQMATEATEAERRIQADAAARAQRDELARKAGIAEQEQRRAAAEAATKKALEEAAEHDRKEAEHRAATLNTTRQEQRDKEEIAASKAREAAAVEEAAEHRARAAEHEARAVEAAALARMSQVDWDVHRVVAMIEARGESAVTVRVIADELGISTGSAQDRKTRAVELLKGGGNEAPEQAAA